MVESLLDHDITNVNVRDALKIAWDLRLDGITGLLLEHIAVDRSRDSINLSGLELTTLKPLWILPSLGVKTLPEAQPRKGHKKQRSLGHVKDFLVRRRSVASGNPVDMESVTLSQTETVSNVSRRLSVDLSSLKYVSEMEADDETEETDFGKHKFNDRLLGSVEESALNNTHVVSDHLYPVEEPPIGSVNDGDSGVGTVATKDSGEIESLAEKRFGVLSRGAHKLTHGTISGATTLPHCTLDQYTLEDKRERTMTDASQYLDGSLILSPSQFFRKLRKIRKKSSSKRLLYESSSNFSSSLRADSPNQVMYYAYEQEGTNEAAPLLSPSDSSFSFDDTAMLVGRESSLHEHSIEEEHSFLTSFDSSLEASPPLSSRVSSLLGTSYIHSPTSGQGADEVDFGSRKPIPEEAPVFEANDSHLIKMLDLSSNQLSDFSALAHLEYGGPLVFKQLKNVLSLDLKQNYLSKLLTTMMQVNTPLYACAIYFIILNHYHLGNDETQ